MRAAIITRHAICNYGSLLQAYATEEVFRKLGYEPTIIDYIREDEEPRNTTKLLLARSKKWNKNCITKFIYYIVQHPDHVIMGKKFRKFQKEWLTLSGKKFKTTYELKKYCNDYDVFCTGSDQVWGNIGMDEYDPAYFLNFVEEGKKKISVAASLGHTVLSDNLKMQYKKLLDEYTEVTVRESSALDLISNITDTNTEQILDPTLLYTKEEWEKRIENPGIKNYILIYQLNANPEMDRYAQLLAQKTNKELIRVSPEFHNRARSGKFVYLPSPGKFLGLIKNVDYMITDSFHGTAFAINFNTQFIDVFPKSKSTRNQSILELTGLMNRVLKDYKDFSIIDQKINFEHVNEIIDKARNQSFEILNNMLKD